MERLAEFTSQRNISFALRNRLWRYFRVYWTENVSTNTRASGAIKHGKGDAGHGSSEENEDEDEEQDEAMIEKHVRDFLHGSWDTVTEATTGMEDVITASPWHQEQEEGRARHGGAVLSDKRRRSEGATSWRAEMLKDSNRAATRGNKLMRMGGVTHASHVLSDADVVNAITLPGLRADVTAELFREITRSVPFLHAKDLGFLEAVAPWMELMRVQPDDLIIHEGERGQEAGMFFVLSGTIVAEFEDDDGTKHAVAAYGAGQYFGVEAMQSILGEPVIERHLLSSRCEDECSLYGLGEASLRHAIEMGYVDVKKELHLEATIRLKHVLNFVQKLPTTTASSKSIRTDSANRYLAGESEDA
jgi:CRP-like cAMP-binding protein